MIIMSWNCKGLENCRAVQVLFDLVRWKGPIILFLMETKLSIQEMETIKNEIGFQSMLAISSVRRGGGVALLWKDTITVDPQTFSLYHIDVHVNVSHQEPWRLTRVYGHPEEQRKKKTWTMLKNLHTRSVSSTMGMYRGFQRSSPILCEEWWATQTARGNARVLKHRTTV